VWTTDVPAFREKLGGGRRQQRYTALRLWRLWLWKKKVRWEGENLPWEGRSQRKTGPEGTFTGTGLGSVGPASTGLSWPKKKKLPLHKSGNLSCPHLSMTRIRAQCLSPVVEKHRFRSDRVHSRKKKKDLLHSLMYLTRCFCPTRILIRKLCENLTRG